MLRELQLDFLQSLFAREDTEQLPVLGGALGVARRLAIYRNNVLENLTGALEAVYPVVRRLVGEAFFHHAARQYACLHPSASGDIHCFGGSLADFLVSFPGASELVYLPDVARLEWLLHEAFHALDQPALNLQRLAGLPAEHYPQIRFKLHPACRMMTSRYPVLRIWETNQPGYVGEDQVKFEEGGMSLLIRRPQFTPEIVSLSPGGYVLLHAFSSGLSLDHALPLALEAQPDFTPEPFLREQVGQGVLVDFYLE